MGIIDLVIKYLQDLAANSEAVYHVNPWVFCILFFGSALPLYYGYYCIGKSFLKFDGKKLKRIRIDRKELGIGIMISIVAWCTPYVYVIFFGRLPINLWIIFIGFVLVMGVFFVKTLRGKVSKSSKGIVK